MKQLFGLHKEKTTEAWTQIQDLWITVPVLYKPRYPALYLCPQTVDNRQHKFGIIKKQRQHIPITVMLNWLDPSFSAVSLALQVTVVVPTGNL